MKLSFNFLERWENAIFEKYQQKEVAPVSAYMAGVILVAAAIMIVAFFVISVFYKGSEREVIIAAAVIFGIALLLVAGKASRNIMSLHSIGSKVGYAAYILVLFLFCSFLFTYLSMIFLALYIFWQFFKAVLGGGSKSVSVDSDDSNVAADCRSCSRYPGHAKYCDLGNRHVSDFEDKRACNFYRF